MTTCDRCCTVYHDHMQYLRFLVLYYALDVLEARTCESARLCPK